MILPYLGWASLEIYSKKFEHSLRNESVKKLLNPNPLLPSSSLPPRNIF